MMRGYPGKPVNLAFDILEHFLLVVLSGIGEFRGDAP